MTLLGSHQEVADLMKGPFTKGHAPSGIGTISLLYIYKKNQSKPSINRTIIHSILSFYFHFHNKSLGLGHRVFHPCLRPSLVPIGLSNRYQSFSPFFPNSILVLISIVIYCFFLSELLCVHELYSTIRPLVVCQ